MKNNEQISLEALKESKEWFEGIKQTFREVDELIGGDH